jgi:hypothetical protein
MFKLIYKLLTKEQEVFKDFVETNLKQRRIRPLILLVRYLILFIKKKGTIKLRLCIDY